MRDAVWDCLLTIAPILLVVVFILLAGSALVGRRKPRVCHVCHGDKRLIRGHEDWGTCQNCGGTGVELYGR